MTATVLFERLRKLKPVPAEIDDTILLDWLNQSEGQILHEIFFRVSVPVKLRLPVVVQHRLLAVYRLPVAQRGKVFLHRAPKRCGLVCLFSAHVHPSLFAVRIPR